MNLNERNTFYDVLDLKPDASPHQIREAYLRAKATYHKDSAALYTLISQEEREEMIAQIEEAYRILSNPQKRKDYDRTHGFIVSFAPAEFNPMHRSDFSPNPTSQKIISIDRIPPMENIPEADDVLVPPPTFSPPKAPTPVSAEPPAPAPSPFTTAEATPAAAAAVTIPAPREEESIQKQIEAEIEWSGAFLKRVREAHGISIEEIANITKINKHYLFAVEEENYAKLPASVYVRGFVTQMAKIYRIPIERVVNAYMTRLILAREPKKK